MLIEGDNINLRDLKPSDYEKILQWSNNELLTYLAGERLPRNIEECKKRYLKSSGLFNIIFAIEDKGGRFLGEIELNHIQWKQKIAELFVYIGEENLWGKGYGTDAINTFIKYIFNEKDFKKIYLRVYQNNKRAIRCYQKCGFKKRGILKIRKEHLISDDLILMDLNISDYINSKKQVAFF